MPAVPTLPCCYNGRSKCAHPSSRTETSMLPLPLTGFVGREREVARLEALLYQSRLLTLVGIGGVGKTRLALRLASEAAHRYPDGVCLVELAALAQPDLVARAVTSALGIAEVPGRPLVA